MDPVSATELAIEGMSLCISAGKIIKATIETIKHAPEDILALAREVTQYQNTLGLLKVAGHELRRTDLGDLDVNIDTQGIRSSLNDLQALADKLAGIQQTHGQIIVGLRLTILKSDATKLLKVLRAQKLSILETLNIIESTAVFKNRKSLQNIQADVAELKVAPAFSAYKSVPSILSNTSRREWLGHTCTDGFDDAYIESRQELADAAYNGDWAILLKVLEIGQLRYGENWVNAFRIRPLSQHDKLSHWTLLHQAALWRAPVDVITKLINLGAFRTLRTQRSRFTYPDQTPLELAMEFGYHELLPMLTPVVRSPVPSVILPKLQSHFHSLVQHDLGDRVQHEHLYLPVLEVLTELEGQAVWFGVKHHTFSEAGYLFRLDGRDLVVRSYNISAEDTKRDYRITAGGISEIESALLINDYA